MNSLRYVISTALLSLLTGLGSAHAADAPARKVAFNIAEQPLGDALRRFGEQTGLQVVLYSEIGRGLKAPKVSGDLTPQGALDRLLANTGLKYEYLNAQTVAISDGQKKDTSSMLTPARGELNLAQSGESSQPAKPTSSKSDIETQEMVVKSQRDRVGGNTDKTRTINDVQPYYIYDSEAIERSGATDVEDFLKMHVTMNTVMMTGDQGQGGDGTQFSNTFYIGPSASNVNLNGLGSNMTLVLIDGRRQGGTTGSGQVDLSTLSPSLIDRIEILPSSASAIYGPNAMGGVVNVVLKRNYTGGSAMVKFDQSESADDGRTDASLSYAWPLESGRTTIRSNFSWADAGILTVADRREVFEKAIQTIRTNRPTFFTSGTSAWLGAGTNIVMASNEPAAANLTFLDGTSLGARATRVPTGFAPGSSASDLRDALIGEGGQYHQELVDTYQSLGLARALARGSTTETADVNIERDMTPWLRMYAGFRYSVRELDSPATITAVRFNVHPSNRGATPCAPANNFSAPNQCRANSPSPFRETVSVAFPIYGALQEVSTNISRSANLGASFTLPHRWVLSLDLNHSRSTTNSWSEGGAVANTILNAIHAGTYNPFVDTEQFRLPIVEDLRAEATPQYISSLQQHSATLHAQGPLMTLPWGVAPSIRLALEHRRFAPDDTVSLLGVSYGMKTYNSSISAETTVPLVRPGAIPYVHGLEVQLAGRMDRNEQETGTRGYQAFGPFIFYDGPTTPDGQPFREMTRQTNPSTTFGFMYQPVSSLMLRASVGSAFTPPAAFFLAPTIPDPEDPTEATVLDPVTGASVLVPFSSGGNPALEPENSESLNAGIIWQPGGVLEGLRLNVEYMDMERENAISTNLSPQFIVDNETAFPGRVTRDANGVITHVDARNANVLTRSNSTLNFSGEYSTTTAAGHFLSLSAQHTRILSIKSRVSITQPERDAAGYPHEDGAVEDKSSLVLRWERNGFSTSWTASRLGAYKIRGAVGGPSAEANGGVPTTANMNNYLIPQGTDTVPAQVRHDVTIGYNTSRAGVTGLFEGVAVTLGIRNIFNVEPPMDVTYGGNFYINPMDRMRMRSFYLTLKKDF